MSTHDVQISRAEFRSREYRGATPARRAEIASEAAAEMTPAEHARAARDRIVCAPCDVVCDPVPDGTGRDVRRCPGCGRGIVCG